MSKAGDAVMAKVLVSDLNEVAQSHPELLRYFAGVEKKADALEGALRDAIQTIRLWHDMMEVSASASKIDRDRVWSLYQESPEMRRLYDALGEQPDERRLARLPAQIPCKVCGHYPAILPADNRCTLCSAIVTAGMWRLVMGRRRTDWPR